MSAPRYNEPARKRQRKTRSCEQCRNLKIKCDQELPACGACRRSREPLSCNYRDSDRLKDAAMAEMYPGGSNEGTVSTSSYTSIARHGHPEPPQGLPAYDETVRKLQERVHRLEVSLVSQVNSRSPRDVRDINWSSITQGLSVDPIIPRLQSTPAKEKLFGQSHWMHVAEKVRKVH